MEQCSNYDLICWIIASQIKTVTNDNNQLFWQEILNLQVFTHFKNNSNKHILWVQGMECLSFPFKLSPDETLGYKF